MTQRRRNSHIEGLATHDDPESCGHAREDVSEALTGAHAGRVLSREIEIVPGAEVVSGAEGTTRRTDRREERRDLARSTTDPEHVWKRHAREPGDPVAALGDGVGGRGGKSEDAIHRCTAAGSLTAP
jgi:hypothetical protein